MRALLGPAALRNRHKNAPRPDWKVNEAFRQWLRGRDCACGGRNPHCGGPIRSAHVDYAAKGTPDAKGTATKVADRWCIPLADLCHKLQHDIGWPEFERRFLPHRGEPLALAYWTAWLNTPSGKKWTADHA